MKEVSQEFLREVQGRGWQIEAVTPDSCFVRCPTPGCGMRAKLLQGVTIPPRIDPGYVTHIPLGSYDEGREALRARRRELRLTIKEVEYAAGIATDHLAKAEKDEPSRVFNFSYFILWARTLGYQVALVPTDLPAATLRAVSETREKVESRARHFRRLDRRQGQ